MKSSESAKIMQQGPTISGTCAAPGHARLSISSTCTCTAADHLELSVGANETNVRTKSFALCSYLFEHAPQLPRLLCGGVVLIDPDTAPPRIIALQHNPYTLTPSLQVKSAGDGADRSEVLRLKGPPIETMKLHAEIDELEFPDQNPDAAKLGLHPQLAALEALISPTCAQLQSNNTLAQFGVLKIPPMESSVTLVVWSRNRIVPVRTTDLSITEGDARLNSCQSQPNKPIMSGRHSLNTPRGRNRGSTRLLSGCKRHATGPQREAW